MKKTLLLLTVIIILIAGFIAFPYYQVYKVKDIDNIAFEGKTKNVQIETPIQFKKLGQLLKQEGIIKDQKAFDLIVDFKKYDTIVLREGIVTIKKQWTNNQLVNQLYLMRNQKKIVQLTFGSVRNLESLASKIAVNLARTISAINLAAAAIDAITFGVGGQAYRAANLPIAIGSAAAQTALVLANTPKFAEGGVMDRDGLMMINDHSSGRLEVVERDGKLLMTDQKNALVEGKKGDIIHKDANEYFNGISDKDIINNAREHSILATISHQNYLANTLSNKMLVDNSKMQTDRIVKAIGKQKTRINLHNNVSLGDELKYINMSNQY